jgi:hypothetical protein
MALTLTEAAKYSNDILQIGVIEKLVYQDPILEKLQFKDIIGNGLTYDVEATMSGASWYGVNETWTESTSTVDQTTAVTHILGGDADIDNFLKATRSNLQDLMTEQIAAKTKAIKKAYMDMFYYGYYLAGAGGDSKGFDGLSYLLRSVTSPYENTHEVGASEASDETFSLGDLEATVDMVKNGPPDLMVMSKLMRRNINTYLRGVGGITYSEAQNARVQTLFGVPVVVSDYISDAESCDLSIDGTNYGHNYADGTALGDDDEATSIFILRFAPEAVCGIQSLPITVEKLGSLETKDATRVRIKWYPGLMLQNILSAARVTGIATDTQAVAV